ncbi:MAG: Hsp20/alpha crystallin family protein [Pirellulaceae bacterium]
MSYHGKDHEKEYVVHAELPGFEPEDFEIKTSGNLLTVRAEHKETKEQDGGSSYRYGSFSRSFTLPEGVDCDNIDASYHSGVLNVRLPKTEQAQAKRIPVTSH